MTAACWADPLSRTERRALREKLVRAGRAFFTVHEDRLWIEMADLHLDVTERAEVPAS